MPRVVRTTIPRELGYMQQVYEKISVILKFILHRQTLNIHTSEVNRTKTKHKDIYANDLIY